jgi:phosphoribosylformylglycinamidine cyclo-ligase
MSEGETYAASGVDIAAGERAVDQIKSLVRSTYRPEVVGDIGGFGGMFDMTGLGGDRPLLVSATDGVGTKAMVASAAGRFDTVGIDLVAMCVDDLVCTGAKPLFFLDYISVGRLDPDHIEQLVAGVAEGCRQAGCALIGGEMAEHPGAMADREFDLVGFAAGVVNADDVITGERVSPGDVLIGLHSPGLRSNGYSLARRLMFDVAGRTIDDPAWEGADRTVGEELLIPSVIYSPSVHAAIAESDVRSVAHITGGGIPGNLNRVLADTTDAVVDRSTWESPRIFDELARIGSVEAAEMAKTFNLGIGMILVVPPEDRDACIAALEAQGQRSSVIGEIVAGGTGAVHLA